MKKLLKWASLLILTLVIIVFILVLNPRLIKTPLERYVSDLAGHTISLEGDLDLNLGSLLEVNAANIALTAPDWANQRTLVKVGSLRLTLQTGSLFTDTIVLNSVKIDDVQINLETSPTGLGNWVSVRPRPVKTEKTGGETRVVFNTIQLKNINFGFFDGEKEVKHVLKVASLEQHQTADGMLNITLDGDYNDKPLAFTGNLGPYFNLLDGHDVTYSGSGSFGSLQIRGNGVIDNLVQPRQPQFNIEINGPEIDKITAMFGFDDLGSGPFLLHAIGNETNGQFVTSINGDIGDITLSVSAETSDLVNVDDLDLELAINGPSLGAFTRTFGLEHWPDKPFNLKAEATRKGSTLNVPDLSLSIGGTKFVLDALLTEFPHLDASRIKLTIAGDDVAQFRDLLGVPGIASGAFEVRGKLDVSPNSVEVLQVDVLTSLGQATFSGTLGDAPDYIGSKLHLHLDGHNANEVMAIFNVDALPEKPFSLDTRVNVVERGLEIERGVLVTIEDERLELGGLLTLEPQNVGSDLEVRLSGKHLNRIVRRLIGGAEVPDQPYDLSGRVRVLETGIQLDEVVAEFAGVKLAAGGLIKLDDAPLSSGLDFELKGEDLSELGQFKLIGDKLNFFVPGQPYQATGRVKQSPDGWQLDKVNGHIGGTGFDIDALISTRPGLSGSRVQFSVNGPDLNTLLIKPDGSDLPQGSFETDGSIALSETTLSVKDFRFETKQAQGKLDVELDWPLSKPLNVSFDVNLAGDNIQHLLPATEVFEPNEGAYKVEAIGNKKGDLITLQNVAIEIGPLVMHLKGQLGEEAGDENVAISFNAVSTDLSEIGLFNGKQLPTAPLDLKAEFNGDARQFVLQDITGTLGRTHIAGRIDVNLKNEKPSIEAEIRSDFFNIRPFFKDDDAASSDTDTPAEPTDRLIPPTPLPLEALAAADVRLSINIAELQHKHDSIEDLVIEAELKSGQLKVDRLAFAAARGDLEASFSIIPTTANNADVKLDVHANDLVLNLSGQAEGNLDRVPKVDFRLNTIGHGSNFQEIAGSSNGSLSLGSRGGFLEGVNLSVLDTFILDEVFSLIMPKSDDSDDLDLTCAAAILKVTNGLIETDPALAFTTSKITLVSKGTVDLKTEEMKLNFNATPNNALKLSASELFNPYILVGGTLSSPAVGLDPAKVILHGGAAIGTAGISILAKGLLDRVNTAIPICEDMLKIVQAQ